MKYILSVIACFQLFTTVLYAQQRVMVTDRLQKSIPVLIKRDYIPGLSIAYIQQGKVIWVKNFGIANAKNQQPVTDTTLFEAASLTKVVTAYAAIKLIDSGLLALDTPLNLYLGNNYDIGNDPRIHLITARRVLSHTAGFPNWRNEGDSLLAIKFTPGDHFSYSGEGFVYLARVIEKITQKPFEQYIAETIFAPLGMKNSNLVYDPALRNRYAYRHNWLGYASNLSDFPGVNAAASLRTTARDYALFLVAVLNAKGLHKEMHSAMFSPQTKVDEKAPQLAWGLGIGLEVTAATTYGWHWGDQGDCKAFFEADTKARQAIVYFTNSANGLSIAPDLMQIVFGEVQPGIAKFVSYGKFEQAAADLVKTIKEKGGTIALQAYEQNRKQPLSEDVINTMGYFFLRENNIADAIAVFTQNTKDHPTSGNAWDSLAEGYMKQGDNKHAIEYYERSLALDPGNQNAVDQLKKLKRE